MTIHRVVWADSAITDAAERLRQFTNGGPPLHRDEQAVFAAIDALRTCAGIDQDEDVVETQAPEEIIVRVDSFVMGAEPEQVRIEWVQHGWDIKGGGFTLYAQANDVNHTGPAFDRARRLVLELRRLGELRHQAAAIEETLREEEVPF